MLTRPKAIEPFHIERAIGVPSQRRSEVGGWRLEVRFLVLAAYRTTPAPSVQGWRLPSSDLRPPASALAAAFRDHPHRRHGDVAAAASTLRAAARRRAAPARARRR